MIAFIIIAGLLVAWAIENGRRKTHPVPAGLQVDISIPHDQEFELYHNALSLCSMKSRVCMSELGIPYKSHHIDLIETGAYENIRATPGIDPWVPIGAHPAETGPALLTVGNPDA